MIEFILFLTVIGVVIGLFGPLCVLVIRKSREL